MDGSSVRTACTLFRRRSTLLPGACTMFLILQLCGAAGVPVHAETPLPGIPAQGSEVIQTAEGRVLGTVEWSHGRVIAQGTAYAETGATAESPAYWRAANRARQQALNTLQALVFRLGRNRQLTLNPGSVWSSVARAASIDRDFEDSSGRVTLTVAADLYGQFGVLGRAPEPQVTTFDPYPRPVPEPQAAVPASIAQPIVPPPAVPEPVVPAITTDGQEGPFTGVVIDCRGLHVAPSMSPKIRTPDGNEVWGTVKVSYKFAEEVGIAGFMDDYDRARSYEHRVGKHPLILKAIARTGGRGSTEAIITDADAARLLKEDAQTHFLQEFHVMFVVDPLE